WLLYDFCRARNVPHEQCGKLVVAQHDSELPSLESLYARARGNGAEAVSIVDESFVKSREPHVVGRAALWSPDTGRVDAPALVLALLREAEAHGAAIARGSEPTGATATAEVFRVTMDRETVSARTVINAAGLYADEISACFGGEPYRIYPCRGEYAKVRRSRQHLINGLVYPLPDPSGHGLGVHLTRTTDGDLLLGPTIRYQEGKDDYEDDRLPLEMFAESGRLLLPSLTNDDVSYGGSGIRAKLHPPEESFADFMIRRDNRQPRLIHAAGIDSPGLTSCLAIARRLATLVQETLD
ncbi:MAG TPA: FAD-dependent oxidoreductase, partial [Lacipirellulaceae bacterium]|nr:FAD-dependent oxidoreductase [Lacipirellulaceae bacterium]